MSTNKMCFIYTLCHNDKVFYVGASMDLYKRYKQHLSIGKSTTKTSLFIKNLLSNNECPELNIIDYVLLVDAPSIEAKYIKAFYLAGQPLTNHQNCWKLSDLPPNIPAVITPKIMSKIVKYKQGLYIHRITGCYCGTEPNEPF